jgi:hypothetical protein
MKRKLVGLITVFAMVIATSPIVIAQSPSQRECEAAGGTFTRSQGTVTCVIETEDPVGNSEKSGGKSQSTTKTEEDSSQGTLNNKPKFQEDDSCAGPGNSGESSSHCN